MTSQEYNYSVSNDIVSGQVDLVRLKYEILASDISTNLEGISRIGNDFKVVFENTLSAGDKTLLDNDTTNPSGGIIGSHSGVVFPNPTGPLMIESLGVSSTTGTSWVSKLKLVTYDLEEAVYRLMWSFSYKTYSQSGVKPTFRARFKIGSSEMINIKTLPELDSVAVPAFGFSYKLLSGINTIELLFRRLGNAGTVYISDARLELSKFSDDLSIVSSDESGSKELVGVEVEPIEIIQFKL